RLFVSEPARILVAVFNSACHEVDRIAATICVFGGGIERHSERARLPGFLLRCDTALEHLNDLVGDLLSEVAVDLCWFARACVAVFWDFWCHSMPPSDRSSSSFQSN